MQVEAAKREIEERLGPVKVAFLRRRAAQRAERATASNKEASLDEITISDKGTADAKTGSQQSNSPGTGVDPLGTWNGPAKVDGPGLSDEASEQKTVVRVRFSLSGEPLGWRPASEEEEAGPNAVVERDLLR